MKRIYLFIFTIFACIANVHSQLVVDSLGRVGIGTDAPESTLSVGNNSDTLSAISCRTPNKTYGIYSKNSFSKVDGNIYSIYSIANNTSGNSNGTYSVATSDNNMSSTHYAIGVSGLAGRAYTAIGVFGGRAPGAGVTSVSAGVYGAEVGSTYSFGTYTDSYAGFFNGKVRVTNGIYGTLFTPNPGIIPGSDGAKSNSAIVLSDNAGRVTNKLSQVQTLQFLRNVSETKQAEEDENVLESSLPAIHYGLDAGQLKLVYPELVCEDANGNISINYVEMVPLLVKCINELSEELAKLKGTSAKKAKAQSETTGIDETSSDVDMVRMDQNKPNPFSESTVIGLNIPEKTQKANIFIYDLSGKQIKSILVSERGETNITVYASDLGAGMYIYTLVTDGKVVVTRRMIVGF